MLEQRRKATLVGVLLQTPGQGCSREPLALGVVIEVVLDTVAQLSGVGRERYFRPRNEAFGHLIKRAGYAKRTAASDLEDSRLHLGRRWEQRQQRAVHPVGTTEPPTTP